MVPHLSVKAIVAALRSLLAGYPWGGGGGGTLPSARNGIIHARAPSLASVRGIRSDPGAGIVHARSGFTASLLGVAEVRHVGIIYATPGFSATVRGVAEKPGALVVHTRSGFSASLLGTAKRTGKVTGRLGTRGSVFGTKVDAVPSAPVLQGTAANGRHDLNWNIPNGNGAPVTSYILYRDLFTGSNSKVYNLGNVTSFTDFTVQNGTEYSWIVVAYNNINNHSGGSNNIFLTFTPQAPATPVLSGTAGDTVTDLTWPTPSSPGSPLQAYTLKRNGVVVSPAPAANSNSYHDIGRTNGTQYTYVLTANNAGGASQPSNAVPLTPQGAVASVVDIPNSDGAWRLLAWGNSFMVNVDETTWASRGFGGYIHGVNFPNLDGNNFQFTTAPAPAGTKYNTQRSLEADFDPGAASCEGYIKSHVRNPSRSGSDSPYDWFNTTERAAAANWWAGVATWMQSRGHGMVGISTDTEQGWWGLDYLSNCNAGNTARLHTDAQTIAQIESWGYAHGQAVFSAMPNCILVTYDCEAPGGYADGVVYTQNKTLDGRLWHPNSDTWPNTYWYSDSPRGPKLQYYIGYLKAMADFGGPGARFVMGQDFYYKPASNQPGKYFYETQGGIAGWSQKFTAAQWAKLYNKIDITIMTWAMDDNILPGKGVQMTGENGSSNHGGAGWTQQQVDARRLGMGTRRIEYIYEGEPSRACYYDANHNAIEQPPGVAQGGGFFFQENNWYIRNQGDLPRYDFSDYNMNFPAFGNPPGGHLPGLIAGKNRSTPLNTTVPTVRDTNGNLNTITKTNLGNGSFRIAGRVSHPNGCRGAACWNITTDPTRQSPKVNQLTWNQAGGDVAGGFPNAYLAFSIDVAGSPSNHVIVQAISAGDQTHNLEIIL